MKKTRTQVHRAQFALLGIALCMSVIASAGPAHAASSSSHEHPGSSSNVSRSEVDTASLITTESGFNAMVTGLFALPGTRALTAPEGLRGRAFNSMSGCAGAVAAIEWRIPGSWFKVAKSLRRAWAGKSVAKDFSFRKVVGMQLLKGSISEGVMDKVGIHVCTEFRMWVNFIINTARSLAFNGQTHAVLNVVGPEFTGLSLWSCKVQPKWGPNINNLNSGKTWYLDNWKEVSLKIWEACPTPNGKELPVKKFALLWQPAPF